MNEEGELSKSQIDRLGSRLRNSAEPDEDDLRLLNRYRERFVPVHDGIVEALRQHIDYPVESRYKSVPSIVAKLRRRQPARLSAIQDIAGARIIVPNATRQTPLVDRILSLYSDAAVDDKRDRPTYGYRAVHLIVSRPLPFEVQIRTPIQHTWAQLSERLADRYGFDLKYGGGPEDVRQALLELGDFGTVIERLRIAADEGRLDMNSLDAVKRFEDRLPSLLKMLKVR